MLLLDLKSKNYLKKVLFIYLFLAMPAAYGQTTDLSQFNGDWSLNKYEFVLSNAEEGTLLEYMVADSVKKLDTIAVTINAVIEHMHIMNKSIICFLYGEKNDDTYYLLEDRDLIGKNNTGDDTETEDLENVIVLPNYTHKQTNNELQIIFVETYGDSRYDFPVQATTTLTFTKH